MKTTRFILLICAVLASAAMCAQEYGGKAAETKGEKVTNTADEQKDQDVVFMVVEEMPEFPGGTQGLFQYLSENVKYPVIAQENGIQGRVVCRFIVNTDGSITDIEVLRSGGDPSLDKEAVRVISSMPNWKPGKHKGKPVRVRYSVPVSFKLTKPEAEGKKQ